MKVASAMILAAGLGTRMRPLTETCPKPLIKVGSRTLLDWVLDDLTRAGITNAVVNVHYKAEMIRTHLASRTDPTITISDESQQLLDTGGGATKALPLLAGDVFLVTNSDALWQGGLAPVIAALIARFETGDADAVLALAPMTRTHGFDSPGDFFANTDGTLERRGNQPSAPTAYSGTQLVHRRIFDDAPEGPFSFNLVWDKAAQSDRLRAIVHDDDWFHVGTPDAIAPTAHALDPDGES